jgi:hypothetical protein
VRVRTVSKWLRRYRAEGEAGLPIATRSRSGSPNACRSCGRGCSSRRLARRRDLRRVRRRGGPIGGSHRGPQRRRRMKTTSFAVTNFRDRYKRGTKSARRVQPVNKRPESFRRDPLQRDAAAATREHRCNKRGSGFGIHGQQSELRCMPVRRRGERLSSAQHRLGACVRAWQATTAPSCPRPLVVAASPTSLLRCREFGRGRSRFLAEVW